MCAVAVSAPRPVSSDPKPREGTETHPTRYRWRASFIESSDPKPREGTETFRRQFVDHEFSESSDPKPREGTETLGIPCADSGFACRQTQNPERGRKPGEQRRRQPGGHGSVVRPKTPRGDGNYTTRRAISQRPPRRQTQNPERGRKRVKPPPASPGPPRSSDPKPREGTETWDICCPPGEMLSEVVRPKTPRGDGNFVDHHCHSLSPRVVRPKTPRGDGNLE
ncbi:Uncharacterised protein [Mycobacterium tuberculosis]|nr:Uncharacterised protein [Mycobacterium tuberculosis]